jgi:ribosomal protein S18 acetylase RimI-like enzyme
MGEMKRLYLRPDHRGSGIGRKMAQRVIEDARVIGYHTLRLDTIPQMKEAISLYRSLGFREISPPPGAPMAGEIYMEMSLRK